MENDGGSVWSQKTNNYEPVLRQSRKKGVCGACGRVNADSRIEQREGCTLASE